MTTETVKKIADVLLSENDCKRLMHFMETKSFNDARLIVDKKLMGLEEQQQLFLLDGKNDPLIEFELRKCNQMYDYILNEIETQLLMKERANGEGRITRRAVISSS